MNRCEDFPCCGHTFDDPCSGSTYNPYNDPHLMCDHDYGCELDDDPTEPDTDWGEVEMDAREDEYENGRF